MGIIKQGILGGLSGKVGNVVGASWKGIDYLRSLPSQVANPNTTGQRTSRGKMSMVVKFLRSCTALVRVGFGGFALKMSAFNAATSYNLQQAVSGEYPNLELDYASLMFSKGTLPRAVNALANADTPGAVEITWDDNSASGTAKGDDTAMVLIYNPVKDASIYSASAAIRSDLFAVIDVPADWATDDVHCYIAFYDNTKTAGTRPKDYTSETVYAGVASVA